MKVVREINSTTLLIKASRSVWHNYFPLYITLHVRIYECLSSQILAWINLAEKLGLLDILSNPGKQQPQFSQNGFSFCVLHCIWQAVRIQTKCRIRCGISSGSTLSAKIKVRSTFILPLAVDFLAVIISGEQGIRTLTAALYSTRPRHRIGSVPFRLSRI